MRTTQTAPQSKDTASQVELYMSFELADKTWKLTISDGRPGSAVGGVRELELAARSRHSTRSDGRNRRRREKARRAQHPRDGTKGLLTCYQRARPGNCQERSFSQ